MTVSQQYVTVHKFKLITDELGLVGYLSRLHTRLTLLLTLYQGQQRVGGEACEH